MSLHFLSRMHHNVCLAACVLLVSLMMVKAHVCKRQRIVHANTMVNSISLESQFTKTVTTGKKKCYAVCDALFKKHFVENLNFKYNAFILFCFYPAHLVFVEVGSGNVHQTTAHGAALYMEVDIIKHLISSYMSFKETVPMLLSR